MSLQDCEGWRESAEAEGRGDREASKLDVYLMKAGEV